MPLIDTPDGHYTHAVTTKDDPNADGNDVVYDNWIVPGQKTPVWDKFSYEAGLGEVRPPVVLPPGLPSPVPVPVTPTPEPASDWQRLKVIPVTDASDGDFVPRMYSYWPNAWIVGRSAYVFAGHVDQMPRFFRVDLATGAVERLGSLIGWTGTTEGWYWTRDGWIILCDGPRLRRVSPFTNEAPVIFDISEVQGIPKNGQLWQAHSSDDGQTHSATVLQPVESGSYPKVGTVVFSQGRVDYYPAHGDLDESQITPDGGWVVIKESFPGENGKTDLTNRIIAIPSRETRILHNVDGAVGHSDCGPGILVGEWSPQFDTSQHGQCVLWDLRGPLVPERRREIFSTWNMGYVSIRGGRCLHSGDQYLSLVHLDGPALQILVEHGVTSTNYDDRVKANLDHTGRVATYMVTRQVYLLVLPA